MKRREFVPSLAATIVGTMVSAPSFSKDNCTSEVSIPQLEPDDFWAQIRAHYRTGEIINLNNAGINPHPIPVEEAFFNYHRICNAAPSFYMWRSLEKLRDGIREKLAAIAGCTPDEIAINRNATEALVTIIMNIRLERGDEVVLSLFDYPRMLNAWKVREERDGIILRWVNPEANSPTDDQIIEQYTAQFNSKTKIVFLTHMINWTGRLVPVKPVIQKAKTNNIITIVDAAHTFAHVPFSISDLDCDYLGASLHKWLSAPFGNGMLYIKKERIASTPTFFPAEKTLVDNIRKFEELGTRNNAAEFAISQAVDFYTMIGAQRKFERLVELKNYWVNAIKNNPNIKIHTPLDTGRSGAITLIEIPKITSYREVDSFLLTNYQIHTITVNHEGLKGTRITPNVYTSINELDTLVEGLLKLADS